MNDQERAPHQPRPEVSPPSPPRTTDPGHLGVVHPDAPSNGNGNGQPPGAGNGTGPAHPGTHHRRTLVPAATRPEIAARLAPPRPEPAPDTPHPTTTPPTPAPGPVHRAAPTAEVPVVADPATVTPNGWGHPPRLDRPDIETTPDADAARALRNGHATAQTNGVATRTPTAATDIDEEPEDTGLTKSLIEWVAVLGGAFVVALVIKTYLFQAFFIPSQSMEPALMVNDRVLVNKLSYELHGVERGDLVVFERPEVVSDDDSDLIKRVVGLPGETIDFLDGTVYIDGEPLDEDYLEDGVPTVPPDAERFPMLLGDDEAFVMGDNRTDSRDSRFFGPIKVDSIIGRAWVRVWPVSDLGLL